MHEVYVLWSQKLGKRYVGVSEDVDARLNQHNKGSTRFTKGGVPCVPLYRENYKTRTEALKRERILKSGVGRAWLDQHLK